MLTQTPEPDGRVAIYENGRLLGRARDQAHADGWCERYMELMHAIAPMVWEMGDDIWRRLTPEQRNHYRRTAEEAA